MTHNMPQGIYLGVEPSYPVVHAHERSRLYGSSACTSCVEPPYPVVHAHGRSRLYGSSACTPGQGPILYFSEYIYRIAITPIPRVLVGRDPCVEPSYPVLHAYGRSRLYGSSACTPFFSLTQLTSLKHSLILEILS